MTAVRDQGIPLAEQIPARLPKTGLRQRSTHQQQGRLLQQSQRHFKVLRPPPRPFRSVEVPFVPVPLHAIQVRDQAQHEASLDRRRLERVVKLPPGVGKARHPDNAGVPLGITGLSLVAVGLEHALEAIQQARDLPMLTHQPPVEDD